MSQKHQVQSWARATWRSLYLVLSATLLLFSSGGATAAGTAYLELHGTGGTRHSFHVEIARTPREQARGLMERRILAPRGGMLFLYPRARRVHMWMANTPISLDMLFIRADHSIARIVERTVPYSRELIDSVEAVSAVLEIEGGLARVLGIRAGDSLCYPCESPPGTN